MSRALCLGAMWFKEMSEEAALPVRLVILCCSATVWAFVFALCVCQYVVCTFCYLSGSWHIRWPWGPVDPIFSMARYHFWFSGLLWFYWGLDQVEDRQTLVWVTQWMEVIAMALQWQLLIPACLCICADVYNHMSQVCPCVCRGKVV